MNRTKIHRSIFAIIFFFGASLAAPDSHASEWRWAKPLNEKVGSAFYTSNLRFKRPKSEKPASATNYRMRSKSRHAKKQQIFRHRRTHR